MNEKGKGNKEIRDALLLSVIAAEEILDTAETLPESVKSACREIASRGRKALDMPERGGGRFSVQVSMEIGNSSRMVEILRRDSWEVAAGYAGSAQRKGNAAMLFDLEPRDFGNYDWDQWEARARAEGIPDDVALLGRAVYRESYQHQWPFKLQASCGWADGGAEMLRVAKKAPDAMRKIWRELMDTDGGRVPAEKEE